MQHTPETIAFCTCPHTLCKSAGAGTYLGELGRYAVNAFKHKPSLWGGHVKRTAGYVTRNKNLQAAGEKSIKNVHETLMPMRESLAAPWLARGGVAKYVPKAAKYSLGAATMYGYMGDGVVSNSILAAANPFGLAGKYIAPSVLGTRKAMQLNNPETQERMKGIVQGGADEAVARAMHDTAMVPELLQNQGAFQRYLASQTPVGAAPTSYADINGARKAYSNYQAGGEGKADWWDKAKGFFHGNYNGVIRKDVRAGGIQALKDKDLEDAANKPKFFNNDV